MVWKERLGTIKLDFCRDFSGIILIRMQMIPRQRICSKRSRSRTTYCPILKKGVSMMQLVLRCKIFFLPSEAAKLSVNFMSFQPLLTYFIPLLVADCIDFVKQAVESENQELELDLSSLGTVNTMFAALFRSLIPPLRFFSS